MAREVTLGRVSGLHGVRGWVRIFSYTDPPQALSEYDKWTLRTADTDFVVAVEKVQPHGTRLLAKIAGVDSREQAAAWVGADIVVGRHQLPPTLENEYYWADLIGLEVLSIAGHKLGIVERLMETGANDVLVVQGDRERLIPWLPGQVIRGVDLEKGRLQVDWDVDF